MAIGPMVEDSIKKQFSSDKVSVIGIDIWNSSSTAIGSFITQTGATYPVAMNGAATASTYNIVANSMVVIDQNGVVQYVKQLGTASTTYTIMRTMVREAASKTRSLLTAGIHYRVAAVRQSPPDGGERGSYSLCGKKVPGRQVSSGIVVTAAGSKAYTIGREIRVAKSSLQ